MFTSVSNAIRNSVASITSLIHKDDGSKKGREDEDGSTRPSDTRGDLHSVTSEEDTGFDLGMDLESFLAAPAEEIWTPRTEARYTEHVKAENFAKARKSQAIIRSSFDSVESADMFLDSVERAALLVGKSFAETHDQCLFQDTFSIWHFQTQSSSRMKRSREGKSEQYFGNLYDAADEGVQLIAQEVAFKICKGNSLRLLLHSWRVATQQFKLQEKLLQQREAVLTLCNAMASQINLCNVRRGKRKLTLCVRAWGKYVKEKPSGYQRGQFNAAKRNKQPENQQPYGANGIKQVDDLDDFLQMPTPGPDERQWKTFHASVDRNFATQLQTFLVSGLKLNGGLQNFQKVASKHYHNTDRFAWQYDKEAKPEIACEDLKHLIRVKLKLSPLSISDAKLDMFLKGLSTRSTGRIPMENFVEFVKRGWNAFSPGEEQAADDVGPELRAKCTSSTDDVSPAEFKPYSRALATSLANGLDAAAAMNWSHGHDAVKHAVLAFLEKSESIKFDKASQVNLGPFELRLKDGTTQQLDFDISIKRAADKFQVCYTVKSKIYAAPGGLDDDSALKDLKRTVSPGRMHGHQARSLTPVLRSGKSNRHVSPYRSTGHLARSLTPVRSPLSTRSQHNVSHSSSSTRASSRSPRAVEDRIKGENLSTALPSGDRRPSTADVLQIEDAKFHKGDPVCVWCYAKQRWINGVVQCVLTSDRWADKERSRVLAAGSFKMITDLGAAELWVEPHEILSIRMQPSQPDWMGQMHNSFYRQHWLGPGADPLHQVRPGMKWIVPPAKQMPASRGRVSARHRLHIHILSVRRPSRGDMHRRELLSGQRVFRCSTWKHNLMKTSTGLQCICEVQGRPYLRIQAPEDRRKQPPNESVFNFEQTLYDCVLNEPLEFSVFDGGGSERFSSGMAVLYPQDFYPEAFDGELGLVDESLQLVAVLRLRVDPCSDDTVGSRVFVKVRGGEGFAEPGRESAHGFYCLINIPTKPKSGFRTKVAKDSKWYEEGEVFGYRPGDSLRFAVFEYGGSSTDDVGHGLLDNAKFKKSGFLGHVALEGTEQEHGRLDVSVFIEAPKARCRRQVHHAFYFREHLKITILRAEGLNSNDSAAALYCKCRIADRPYSEFSTQEVRDQSPQWNHMGALHDCGADDTLELEVYDMDANAVETKKGKGLLPASTFRGTGYVGSVDLVGHDPTAKLWVKVEVSSVPRPVVGTYVSITVHAAEGLQTYNGNSPTKAYVVCSVAGKPKACSHTRVVPDTSAPSWSESFIIRHYSVGDALEFKVLDFDRHFERILGMATMDSRVINSRGFDGHLHLKRTHNPDATLHVSVHVPSSISQDGLGEERFFSSRSACVRSQYW